MLESDTHILALASSDKIQVFEMAFVQYWERLYRQAYKKTQAEDVSKDLVQEVFMVYWDALENITAPDEVLPYLYGVLRNKILKQYQKSEVHLRYAMAAAKQEMNFDNSSDSLLLNKELQELITDEVEKMPSRMKEIYLLKKEEEFSVREIAEKLGLSEQTVKNQLQNAYGRLRLRVKDYNSPFIIAGFVLGYMPMLLHR